MGYMRNLRGRRLDDIDVPSPDEIDPYVRAKRAFAVLDNPAPLLDLNYETKGALYGFETYTRAGTLGYTDIIGASQTAAINTPAFDYQPRVLAGWRVPLGLSCSGSGYVSFNPTTMLPSSNEYTIVLDVERPSSFTGSGAIFAMHSGAATHRVEIGVNASYQPYATVQASGSVQYNVALGPNQDWYGGTRRLVFTMKASGYVFADTGKRVHSQLTASSAPARANLTNLNIGGSTGASSYFTGWVRRVRVLPVALTATQALALSAGDNPVACWGDSLTDGTGATGQSAIYPELLRAMRWPPSGVYEGGVGGETSTQIKTRMVAGTMMRGWTTVIWAGRNNYNSPTTVLADIAEMVATLTHRRFLILSVINKADGTESSGSAGHTAITSLNAQLATAYPNNYLDIRSLIVAASAGTGDAPNSSWTSDGLHLNNTGYAYVAGQVSDFLRGALWY